MKNYRVEFDENRTFGVEIEIVNGNYSQNDIAVAIRRKGLEAYQEGYNHNTRTYWKVITDSSCGFEVVSPVLKGYDGLNQIKLVCEALEEVGAKVNKSCGLHVHHDITDYTLKNFQSLYKLYIKYEEALDSVFPNSRRGDSNAYCRSLIQFSKEYTIERIMAARNVDDIRNIYGTRYKKLNIESYVKYGTIEFRQHSGTTNGNKITNWVMFSQAMISKAKQENVTQKVNHEKTSLNDLIAVMGCNRSYTASQELMEVAKFFRKRQRELAIA